MRSTMRHQRPTRPVVDWGLMRDIYDVRLKDLEVLTNIGQGLLSGIALPAALGAPLLVIGAQRSWAYAGFGVGLLLYLIVLGVALRHALRVLYSPADVLRSKPIAGFGVMQWRDVAAMTPTEYHRYVESLDRLQARRSLVEQDWLATVLVADKAAHVTKAVRWAGVSYAFLGLLVLTRFATPFYS
jgi:hypothetical protein